MAQAYLLVALMRQGRYGEASDAAVRARGPRGFDPKIDLSEAVANAARRLPMPRIRRRPFSGVAAVMSQGTGLLAVARINGTELPVDIDTGASFSVIRETPAKALKLKFLAGQVTVATPSGNYTPARIAFARSLRIAEFEVGEVVFLVVPNAAAAIPGSTRWPLVGLPVQRAVNDDRVTVTSQDYEKFKSGDFLDVKDAPILTKQSRLSNGQLSETTPFGGDARRQAVTDAFEKDLQFQTSKLVERGAKPADAEAWADGQRIGQYSMNGMAPPSWKESMTTGMNQITTAVASGKQMPDAAVKAFQRYNTIASQAPNLLQQVTDDSTRTFFDIARAFPGSPPEQLRAASQYWAKRDERTEKVKQEDVRKEVDGLKPGWFMRNIGSYFTGGELPENMGVMQDLIVKRAGLLVTSQGASPQDAVKKATEQVRSHYSVINGWAIDTNDKRLPPNFETLAEQYISNVVGAIGNEKLEAQSDKDITLSPRSDGTFELFNKRTHLPIMEALPLQRRDGSNFDARFLSPELIQEVGQTMREEAERKAVKAGQERLQPLFVIPGTRLGLSRPSTGYTPGEMGQIQKNIDTKSAEGVAVIDRRIEDNARLAAERNAEVARGEEEALNDRTPRKTLKPFIELGRGRQKKPQ